MQERVYTPLPTTAAYVLSEKLYDVIMGPRGSGKTTGTIMKTLFQARQTEEKWWPLKFAVIRDTRANLGRSFGRSIRQWLPAPHSDFVGKQDEPDACKIYLGPKRDLVHIAHLDFFGVNSAADFSRFQSYEASGGVIIEEPCPLKTNDEASSAGIQESVLAAAVTCLRAAPRPRVMIASNPPSGDHWLAQLFHLPGWEAYADLELEMDEEQLAARARIREQSGVFITPPEECAAELVSPGYRERNRDIYLATGDRSLFARLVEGRVSSVDVGVRVTPEFHGGHIVQGLRPMPHVPAVLGLDYGLNPTCIIAQVTPSGYLNILKAWTRENVGMKQLMEEDVQPWLAQSGITSWWYAGGVEGREREQSDSEETALRKVFEVLGPARYVAAPVGWSARRQGLKEALERGHGGTPWVRIDGQGAALLVRCLDGGWAYETNASEQVRNEQVPPKKRYSHLGDAMCALACALLRKTEAEEKRKRGRPLKLVTRYPAALVGGSRTGV
jgi:hypothetical protein